jgi:hypothetical protein
MPVGLEDSTHPTEQAVATLKCDPPDEALAHQLVQSRVKDLVTNGSSGCRRRQETGISD